MQASWSVMTQNGNLSGASNLAVLHAQATAVADGGQPWILGLSMGPGMCLEGVVMRRVSEEITRCLVAAAMAVPAPLTSDISHKAGDKVKIPASSSKLKAVLENNACVTPRSGARTQRPVTATPLTPRNWENILPIPLAEL